MYQFIGNTLILLLLTNWLFAQNTPLTGIVTDSLTQEPLTGVNIFVLETKTGTTTDFNGNYQLNLTVGNYTLQYSIVGYETKELPVLIRENEPQNISIQLREQSERLNLVVISSSQYQKNIAEETVSVDVITQESLKNRNVNDLGQAVERLPGVQIQDGQITIRGGASYSFGVGSRTAVLSDGLSLMSADLGDAQLTLAPIENAEQIEVIKGASSVVYGSAALGGVVNVRTAWPTNTEAENNFTVQAGIFQDPPGHMVWYRAHQPSFMGGDYQYKRKKNNWQYIAGASLFSLKSYLQDNDNFRFKTYFKTRRLSSRIKGLNYGINGSFMYEKWGRFVLSQDMDTLGFRRFADSNDGYIRSTIDPHLTYQDNKGNRFSIKSRYLTVWRESTVSRDPNASANFFDFENQYQKNFNNRFILTVGLPFNVGFAVSNLYPGTFGLWGAGAYVQGEFKTDRLSLVGGARYEATAVDIFKETKRPVFRAGINYRFGNNTFLRASWGQAYRVPTIAERYVQAVLTSDIVLIIPNKGLRTEKSWSGELGLKQGIRINNWKGFFDAAFFWQEYDNFVEYRLGLHPNEDDEGNPIFSDDKVIPIINQLLGLKPFNIEAARVAGYEASVVGEGQIGPVSVNTLFGYTYTYPVNLQEAPDMNNAGNYLNGFFSDMFQRIDSSRIYTRQNVDVLGGEGTDSSFVLQFRSRHIFKGDIQFNYKRFSFGVSSAYTSLAERFPTLFNTAIAITETLSKDPEANIGSLAGVILNPNRETSLNRYVEQHRKGDLIFDVRLGYEVNDRIKLNLVVRNATHRIYSKRPGIFEAPRNFALQVRMKL